ncbi:DUF934 domain-containing protein [Aquabacter sp. L1I39]|uniref:DUF934 domain-containing protein n=1 Tax=Aquabacter sp. L1I39 TaxID=2820278 RepID=UPI001ADB40CB|nr:DUF934 domain-containing protein [Aquabacter sp. L1I39]QTL04613.1 DUF934 domain-containing protein [Aquabacter sp. L1I39]
MPLVKNGAVVPDAFTHTDAQSALPEGPVIVPLSRLLAEHETLLGGNRPVGVAVSNDADVTTLAPFIDALSVVVLSFPKFRDGRAYSQARLLRERLRYGGELRASGNVLRDQILLMARCGFDAFEIDKPSDVGAFASALATYSVFYQPTGDGRAIALDLRRRPLQGA